MSKEKNLKPSKELPLGFVDRQEKELLIRDFVISNIKEVMTKYGFQYLETPSFEYTDSIGKFLPDKERPDQGVFSFKDEKKWLSLRYDLTAPLARYVAKNYLELPKPFKRYQLGTVWRNEKPGPGRFREFLQFDADYVGTKNLQADAELCVLISEILEKCGLVKTDYTVKISSRKFTDKLFEQLKIKSKEQISTTLRKIFQDYNFKNYKFDPSVIRGLEYYTGPIFEVNLNFEVKNLKGQAIQFGSIGGGGRYDNLVSSFGNFDCPATGISIGLDRLVFALMQKKDFKIKAARPVIICVFDKSRMKEYIEILNKLRMLNISSEIYPGEGKLKKQMEYANKIDSPAVILYGDNEIKTGKATLKNLETGNES